MTTPRPDRGTKVLLGLIAILLCLNLLRDFLFSPKAAAAAPGTTHILHYSWIGDYSTKGQYQKDAYQGASDLKGYTDDGWRIAGYAVQPGGQYSWQHFYVLTR